jgi:hypothetical protein
MGRWLSLCIAKRMSLWLQGGYSEAWRSRTKGGQEPSLLGQDTGLVRQACIRSGQHVQGMVRYTVGERPLGSVQEAVGSAACMQCS